MARRKGTLKYAKRLPNVTRQMVVDLTYLHGMTMRQAGMCMGITRSQVKRLLAQEDPAEDLDRAEEKWRTLMVASARNRAGRLLSIST